MRNDYTSESFKNWLNKLQQESWQLELLISGFAIFGLINLQEYALNQLAQNYQYGNIYKIGFLASVTPIVFILLFNLIFHVLLRGLWIGALGLRYVSGDIDYDNLNYSKKFSSYLKKKVGSFDRYISRLEDYCSVMFAISFLMVFYVLGLALLIIIFYIGTYYFNLYEGFLSDVVYTIGNIIGVIFLLGALLTFIDFITQGLLKRKNWVSKIYFPFYKVFSYLTLSFLYRPLIYNFLDNTFGKRITLLLFPLYLIIFLSTGTYYKDSNYLSHSKSSTRQFVSNNNYYELLPEKEHVNIAAIPNKVLTNKFLNVFIPYDEDIENSIFDLYPSLHPKKDKRGIHSGISFEKKASKKHNDSLVEAYLKAFEKIYSIHIDDTTFSQSFIVSENKKKQLGFETVIKINSLNEGKHILHVKKRLSLVKEKDSTNHIISIPFWYYPN